MRKLLLVLTALLLMVTTASLWMTEDNSLLTGTLPESTPGQNEALIGGAFTLTSQDGKVVKDTDFSGRIMLVFFGFTHCPDICPVSMATLSQVMQSLGTSANQVTPVFITVDPTRDTPEALKEYLANFDSRIVGLTGTDEQIAQAASAYKAYYAQALSDGDGRQEKDYQPEHHAHGASGELQEDAPEETSLSGDYNVDHSGFIYMMGKDGKYLRHFAYNASADDIMAALKPYVAAK